MSAVMSEPEIIRVADDVSVDEPERVAAAFSARGPGWAIGDSHNEHANAGVRRAEGSIQPIRKVP